MQIVTNILWCNRRYVNAEVDSALDTAVPNTPTVDSINERVRAVDGKLPGKAYLTGTSNADGDIQADEATGNFPGTVQPAAGDATVANQTAILDELAAIEGTGFVKDTNSLTNVTAPKITNVTVSAKLT